MPSLTGRASSSLKRKIGAAACAVLAAGAAFAQTTTVPRPDGFWRGSLSAGATAVGGNNQTLNVGVNADAVRQTGHDKAGIYFQDIYARSTANNVTQTTAKRILFGGRYDRDLTDGLYTYGGLDLEKNAPADIRLRTLPQVGLGYHVVKSEPFTFNLFLGYAYNHTVRYTSPNLTQHEAMVGEETIHKLSPTTSFHQRLVFFPSLTQSGEYRGQFDAGLVTAIVRSWHLVLTASDRYDHRPPPGIKPNDYILFTGIQYLWGPR